MILVAVAVAVAVEEEAVEEAEEAEEAEVVGEVGEVAAARKASDYHSAQSRTSGWQSLATQRAWAQAHVPSAPVLYVSVAPTASGKR